MLQARTRFGFIQETFDELWIAEVDFVRHFERHFAIQLRIVRPVDDTECSRAQWLFNLVASNLCWSARRTPLRFD